MSLAQNNFEIMKKNQNSLRRIEQMFTTGKVDDLSLIIDQQRIKITNEIIDFVEKHTDIKRDIDGLEVSRSVKMNPLVISSYFFKPIINIASQEPEYNAEKLGVVFDYYCHIIGEVNDKIGNFPSSIASFCRLAGITSSTLRGYKNSSDLNMRIIAEKIYDQMGDENLTMSQLGAVSEKTTIFKMKTQNEMIEKQQPSVHINIEAKPDMEDIQSRIDKYGMFANKKDKK